MGWGRGYSGTETWTDSHGWGCWGPRRTRERVSRFVAEAADGCQHLVLAAEGAEVPLGLVVSTVLSQAWAGAVLGAELPSAHTASPGHQAGYTSVPGQVTRSCPSPCRSPHPPGLGGAQPVGGQGPRSAGLSSGFPRRLRASSLTCRFSELGLPWVGVGLVGTPRAGRWGRGLVPTDLDFIWPDLKGLNDAGQEIFDLLEMTMANTPGPVHQEELVHGCGGCAAELGVGWEGREGGRSWARATPF